MDRFTKFLEKRFKLENDDMGIPSIIIIGGVNMSLTQSIDRKRILTDMRDDLIDYMVLPKDMADSFAIKITEARAKIATIDFTSEEGKAAKAKIMQQIGMV